MKSNKKKHTFYVCASKSRSVVTIIDHIHMLVKIPPTLNISQFMGYLKGKSALMIFDNHANLKYNYGSRHFWAKGYYISTVGLNK